MTKKETNVNEDKEEKVEQEIVMKPETNFTSCSEEIRYYMKSRLAVEEECTKQVLIDFVKKSVREPEQLTENMFPNTLRALTDAGEIMQVARGTYRKCGSCSMKEKIAGILRKARQDISKVCTVNILNGSVK